MRVTVVSVLAASLACVLAAPFGTHGLALPARTLFWTTLIGFNALKWRLWYRYVPLLLPDTRLGRAAFVLGGAVLLNAMLPFEIDFLFRAVGKPVELGFFGLFLMATLISLAVSAVVAAVAAARPASDPVPLPSPQPMTRSAVAPASGLAARTTLDGLHAVVAEDHYLRLHMADGRQTMVLYRFGDAVRDLAGIDGLQVHRGAWVAEAAAPHPVRDGRKWRLRLANGAIIAVSDSYVNGVRARGWLG